MRKHLKHLTALLLVVTLILPSLPPIYSLAGKGSREGDAAHNDVYCWWASDLKCGANTSVPVAVQNNYSKVSKYCNETKHQYFDE